MKWQKLSLRQRIKRDKITDMRELRELMEFEMRNWGPRMRFIQSMGEPTAGLGFAGVVVPNTEPVVAPASVSSQAEVQLYTQASTGTSTWMWIPQGNIRAPQSWRVWAGGTYSTSATTATIQWITRVGSAVGSANQPTFGSTGAMAPGSSTSNNVTGASATGFPWWYEAHLGIRTPGTSGTAIGFFNVELARVAAGTDTATGMGGGYQASFDMTAGACWGIDVIGSASPTTGAQLQHMTIVAWD